MILDSRDTTSKTQRIQRGNRPPRVTLIRKIRPRDLDQVEEGDGLPAWNGKEDKC